MWSVGVVMACGRGARSAPRPFVRLRLRAQPTHVLTLPGFALTHFSAALSGLILSPAIHFATSSWSAFVSVNRFAKPTAGEPLVANFELMSFMITVTP